VSLITRREGLILAAPAIIGLRPKLARAQMGLPAGLGDEFTPVTTKSLIEVPLGVSLGTYLGGGGGTEGSISAHWSDVKTGFGRTPTILAAVGVNSYQQGGYDSYDYGVWANTANGLPLDGSVSPVINCLMTNSTSTDTDYAGVIAGTYDSAIQNVFDQFKGIAPFTKMYLRINWEFNINLNGTYGVPNSGEVSNWVAAQKHWCNLMHTWGSSNGITVRTMWSPAVSYSANESDTFSLPVVNFFPAPDGSAVNGRYIDVICWDEYMNTGGVSSESGLAQTTTPLSSCTIWSMGTGVAMCQTYNANFGIPETGDGPVFDNNNAWTDGTMLAFANYCNTFATLSPPVPIEFISLFDVSNGGVSSQQSGSGGYPNNMAGFRSMLGIGGNGSIPTIMTIPPI